MKDVLDVGIIGCGAISNAYLSGIPKFSTLRVVACADLDLARAEAKAAEYGIQAKNIEDLLADPEIDLVINLTIPKAHAEVCLAALRAGKHVHVEKPLAVTVEEGEEIMALAEEKGLRVGCAPDTFLGGGLQTCRKLIDDGWIGELIGANAFMLCPGHEFWHPDPGFYYQQGGGPLFDMGPYYLTAFVHLLGPISQVSGMASTAYTERKITSQPKFGEMIKVETPTHIHGQLRFANGAIATLVTSFDVFGGTTFPNIELYGTEGTLRVPDPNTFGGPVLLRRKGEAEWREMPLTHGVIDNGRGIGAADLAHGILHEQPHRANGAIGMHVLEAMSGLLSSSDTGIAHQMISKCEQPQAMPMKSVL